MAVILAIYRDWGWMICSLYSIQYHIEIIHIDIKNFHAHTRLWEHFVVLITATNPIMISVAWYVSCMVCVWHVWFVAGLVCSMIYLWNMKLR